MTNRTIKEKTGGSAAFYPGFIKRRLNFQSAGSLSASAIVLKVMFYVLAQARCLRQKIAVKKWLIIINLHDPIGRCHRAANKSSISILFRAAVRCPA